MGSDKQTECGTIESENFYSESESVEEGEQGECREVGEQSEQGELGEGGDAGSLLCQT